MSEKVIKILAFVGGIFIICSVFGLGFSDFEKAVGQLVVWFVGLGTGTIIIIFVGIIWFLNKNNDAEKKPKKKSSTPRKPRAKKNETQVTTIINNIFKSDK